MSEQAAVAIKTESLTKIYQRRQIALNCVDLEVEPGATLALLGQNGAGKTTLIKLLLGLHVPTAGRVYVLGHKMTPNAGWLRQKIGYLPANPVFPPHMSPIDYLDYCGRLCGVARTQRRTRLANLLRATDLLRVSGETIRLFSTGMKARLAIAASLINDPEILIWDEPAQGLDHEAHRTMLHLMRTLTESKTLILSSHYLPDIQQVCERALVLHEGQVVFHGDFEQLRGELAPSAIEISLSGERKEIAEAVKAIGTYEEIASCKLERTVLQITCKPNMSVAGGLANVLATLADKHVDITDLRLSGEQTEEAIAQLLREEGSRGLTRAYQTVEAR